MIKLGNCENFGLKSLEKLGNFCERSPENSACLHARYSIRVSTPAGKAGKWVFFQNMAGKAGKT